MVDFSNRRAALVVAHSGHELRVYQWLRLARPICFVLTDGAGRSNVSRLPSTTKLLEQTGARAACIYGRFSDPAIYLAIMKGDVDLFIALTEELARELVREEVEYVVGDAVEGYNPVHDVCRYMINAAVERASRRTVRPVLNFEILLTSPSATPRAETDGAMWLHLDEESASRKLEAAAAYPGLGADVERILNQEGTQGVQTELLHPARNRTASDDAAETPYYELYGEKQVAAGHYEQVLRYRDHVRPIVEALVGWVERAP